MVAAGPRAARLWKPWPVPWPARGRAPAMGQHAD